MGTVNPSGVFRPGFPDVAGITGVRSADPSGISGTTSPDPAGIPGMRFPDSSAPCGLISFYPAVHPVLMLPAPFGIVGVDSPFPTAIPGMRHSRPAGCSPFCTTAFLDLPVIRRPVVLPGLWMQISL
jgi:hypothetical protein